MFRISFVCVCDATVETIAVLVMSGIILSGFQILCRDDGEGDSREPTYHSHSGFLAKKSSRLPYI